MEPDQPATAAKHRLSPTASRRLRIAAAVLLGLVLLWSAAWFYAPPLIREQAERIAGEKLGRRVSLGAVAFNPWTLELTLNDLVVAGPPPNAAGDVPAAPLLRVRRLHADAAFESLLRLAPVIDQLEIDAPELRLTRVAEGRFDIDDILARLAKEPGSAEPARFAVHNIVLTHGSADFTDAPMQATHQLRALELAVPFISSLPSQRQVRVKPLLAFTLDGSRFQSAAVATPFSERGEGTLSLSLKQVDISRWLGYVPRGLPVALRSALLSCELNIAFEQRPKLSLRVSGTVDVGGLALADAAAAPLLEAGRIHVVIDELRPLEGLVKLGRIEVEAPHLLAVRNTAGKVNLLLEADAAAAPSRPLARVPLPTTAASAAAAASAPTASRWKVQLAELALRAGRLDWRDAAVAPAATLAVDAFMFDAKAIQWPLDAPVIFEGSGTLAGAAGQGRFRFSGQGNAAGAKLRAKVDAVPLALAAPYLRPWLALPLAGRLDAEVAADWLPGSGAPRLKVEARRLAVDALRLGDAKAPELAADRIELVDATLDTAARTASLGRFALHAPRLRIVRDREQHWSVERWRTASASQAASGSASGAVTASASTTAPAPAPAPASASASASASPSPSGFASASATAVPPESASVPASRSSSASHAEPPWKLSLGEFVLAQGRIGYLDQALAMPVALDIADLAVEASRLALDGPGRAPFHVSARLQVPAGPGGAAVGSGFAGSADVRGELDGFAAGVPASVKATLLLKDLPLHLLDPYLDDVLDIDVVKAQTSFKGSLAWDASAAGPRVRLSGDVTVDDFRANSTAADRGGPQRSLDFTREAGSAAAGRQLLSWKTLSLRGIEVALAPGAPTRVSVAETALGDFYARIVLDESGKLNLQDVSRPHGPGAPAGAASASASVSASAPAVRSSPSATSAPTATAPAPIVTFGPVVVVGGRVAFADRFVRPNYSANLSELAGRLGAFSSVGAGPGQTPQLAELALTGRVEGTATLEIAGQVNPLAKPLALDIRAKVRDLELPPLSPYAIKYAGYGIERGKMSVDLGYLVKPDGQLTASNKIVLNQLAFGEKVEGAPASLPVKLAVALLADRHGVIDLDLPVSGSINDPQFSLGGVIWKVITNLIVKAVTAPFSLLAAAFEGGSSEASSVAFAPGTAALSAAAKESLDKVAKALAERPQLTMTVTGESRLDVERDAWKQERLKQLVGAEKRRAGIAGGAAADAEISVSEAEYPALLKGVYQRADIVKPKNVVGLAKDLPQAEMEALLLAAITVPDDAMQQLAVRRGVAVRDYLAGRELPTTRLFLGAPKTASGDEKWAPRADLKLAAE